jgi:hypothetical protein
MLLVVWCYQLCLLYFMLSSQQRLPPLDEIKTMSNRENPVSQIIFEPTLKGTINEMRHRVLCPKSVGSTWWSPEEPPRMPKAGDSWQIRRLARRHGVCGPMTTVYDVVGVPESNLERVECGRAASRNHLCRSFKTVHGLDT